MDRVAITGGVADGKSTVLRMLRDLGRSTIDADSIVAELWGDSIYIESLRVALGLPGISKSVVRAQVLPDPHKRRILNHHFHEHVMRRIDASGAEFVEIPLLFETCTYGQFSQIWVVQANPEQQIERLTAKLGALAAASAILDAQLPTVAKIQFCDELIRTNLSLELVQSQVSSALDRWHDLKRQ